MDHISEICIRTEFSHEIWTILSVKQVKGNTAYNK